MGARMAALHRHHLTIDPAPLRGGAGVSWRNPMTDNTDEIRRLNDLARTRPETVNATWVMTQGVAALVAGETTPRR